MMDLTAKMRNNAYVDLIPDWEYEIERIYSHTGSHKGHIKLKNNPRRYYVSDFDIFHKGEKITVAEAYRIYKFYDVMKKVGMRN